MALIEGGKLVKLKISAYKTDKRDPGDLVEGVSSFEAMFNPESLTQGFEVLYGKNQAIGSSAKPQRYANSIPSGLSLTLILDGSGTTEMGIARLLPQASVSQRIEDFLKVAFKLTKEIHEPNYLVLEWGDIVFNCRLGSLNIRYTSFARDGTPLRAELDIRLVSDESPKDIPKMERRESPDVSHGRVVKSGDTLPMLSKEIYGSSSYYLLIAQANGLDDIRQLTPGQRLVFPPLDLKAGR